MKLSELVKMYPTKLLCDVEKLDELEKLLDTLVAGKEEDYVIHPIHYSYHRLGRSMSKRINWNEISTPYEIDIKINGNDFEVNVCRKRSLVYLFEINVNKLMLNCYCHKLDLLLIRENID